MNEPDLLILTCGGTIDKNSFESNFDEQIGSPQIEAILTEGNLTIRPRIVEALRRDSLNMTAEDRAAIRQVVIDTDSRRILITHGTDTMIETARSLEGIPGKTIVLTGAMRPAIFRNTDAIFNVGCAIMAVQLLAPGVYIAMSGQVFSPDQCLKNRERGAFEGSSLTYGESD